MEVKYVEYKDRADWLSNRRFSLGASDMASACGMGFKSRSELWREKTGKEKPKDLSQNERVHYGTEAEQYIRGLFALKHEKEYKVEYFPYRVYYNDERPFLTATLDGEITEIETGGKGIWECKTAYITNKNQVEEWKGGIPQHYFIQVLQQMYVTNRNFVILTAELIHLDGNSEIREYKIERQNHLGDIEYVLNEADKMWEYIQSGKEPPTKITI